MRAERVELFRIGLRAEMDNMWEMVGEKAILPA